MEPSEKKAIDQSGAQPVPDKLRFTLPSPRPSGWLRIPEPEASATQHLQQAPLTQAFRADEVSSNSSPDEVVDLPAGDPRQLGNLDDPEDPVFGLDSLGNPETSPGSSYLDDLDDLDNLEAQQGPLQSDPGNTNDPEASEDLGNAGLALDHQGQQTIQADSAAGTQAGDVLGQSGNVTVSAELPPEKSLQASRDSENAKTPEKTVELNKAVPLTLWGVIDQCTWKQDDSPDTDTTLARLKFLEGESKEAKALGVELGAMREIEEEQLRLQELMVTDAKGNQFVVDDKFVRVDPSKFVGVSKPGHPHEPQFLLIRPGKYPECSIDYHLDEFNQEIYARTNNHPLFRSWFSFRHKYGPGAQEKERNDTSTSSKLKEPGAGLSQETSLRVCCIILAGALGVLLGFMLLRLDHTLLSWAFPGGSGILNVVWNVVAAIAWFAIVVFLTIAIGLLFYMIVGLWGFEGRLPDNDQVYQIIIGAVLGYGTAGLNFYRCIGCPGASPDQIVIVEQITIAAVAFVCSFGGNGLASRILRQSRADAAELEQREKTWAERRRQEAYEKLHSDFTITATFRGTIHPKLRHKIFQLQRSFDEVDLIQADPNWIYSDSKKAIRTAGLTKKTATTITDTDPAEAVCLIMVRKKEVYWIADWMVKNP